MPELDDLTELQVDSDSALFDGAVAETPVETPEIPEAPESETPAVTDEQPRAPNGQFAAKGEQSPVAETPVVTPTPEPDGGQIPAWRLREEADAKRALQAERDSLARELDQLRRNPPSPQEPPKAKEKPDPLLDPDGYRNAVLDEVKEMVRAERGEASLQAARDANTETFDKAYAEAQRLAEGGDTHVLARVRNARDPGKELLKWYGEREVVREVGNDPSAYKQRLLDDAVKDPAFQAKVVAAIRAQQNPASVPAGTRNPSPVRLPPSLSTVTPSGSAIGAGDDDVSDEGLFRHATAGIGR